MSRDASDKEYVLDLCDEVLNERGLRQHRFEWLLGDPGTNGRAVKLPVDGFWPDANLVVEYRERQHDHPVPHFDKPDRLTVSGVHRGAQRAPYDARRDQQIPAHGIRLVIIKPRDLDSTARGRLRRFAGHRQGLRATSAAGPMRHPRCGDVGRAQPSSARQFRMPGARASLADPDG